MRSLFSRLDRTVDAEPDDRAQHVDVEIAGWTVVRLVSDLSAPACDDLERQLRPRLVRGARIALDLRHAHLHRAACPTALRELQDEADAIGAELVVVESDAVLRSELLLAGVVDVHPSLDAAVHHGLPTLAPSETQHASPHLPPSSLWHLPPHDSRAPSTASVDRLTAVRPGRIPPGAVGPAT